MCFSLGLLLLAGMQLAPQNRDVAVDTALVGPKTQVVEFAACPWTSSSSSFTSSSARLEVRSDHGPTWRCLACINLELATATEFQGNGVRCGATLVPQVAPTSKRSWLTLHFAIPVLLRNPQDLAAVQVTVYGARRAELGGAAAGRGGVVHQLELKGGRGHVARWVPSNLTLGGHVLVAQDFILVNSSFPVTVNMVNLTLDAPSMLDAVTLTAASANLASQPWSLRAAYVVALGISNALAMAVVFATIRHNYPYMTDDNSAIIWRVVGGWVFLDSFMVVVFWMVLTYHQEVDNRVDRIVPSVPTALLAVLVWTACVRLVAGWCAACLLRCNCDPLYSASKIQAGDIVTMASTVLLFTILVIDTTCVQDAQPPLVGVCAWTLFTINLQRCCHRCRRVEHMSAAVVPTPSATVVIMHDNAWTRAVRLDRVRAALRQWNSRHCRRVPLVSLVRFMTIQPGRTAGGGSEVCTQAYSRGAGLSSVEPRDRFACFSLANPGSASHTTLTQLAGYSRPLVEVPVRQQLEGVGFATSNCALTTARPSALVTLYAWHEPLYVSFPQTWTSCSYDTQVTVRGPRDTVPVPSVCSFARVPVPRESVECQRVCDRLNMRSDHGIVSVERVQHPRLWTRYQQRIAELKQSHPDSSYCELLLWHGSSPQSVRAICETGFQLAFSKRTKYGRGNYFACDASVALRYSRERTTSTSNGGVFELLLCLVAAHTVVQGPPAMKAHQGDCAVDDLSSASLVVTFDDRQSYPAYVVSVRM